MVAVVGAAALGAGLLLAQHLSSERDRRADVAALPDAPAGTASAVSGPAELPPQASPSGGAPYGEAAGAPAGTSRSRPPSDAPQPTASPIRGVEAREDVPATVQTYGADNGQTMRVVTARGDLTGQREMAWAADSGHRVGDAWCTQNFRFSPDRPASVRPTMLLCWRTSAHRSAYVVTVNPTGKPSEQDTVAVINREWSKLG